MPRTKETFLRIANWAQMQHYTDRNPPWIKLYNATLNEEWWVDSSDSERVLAIALMLIASKNDNAIPYNPRYVQRIAYLDQPPDFEPLIRSGFLVETEEDTPEPPPGASTMLAGCKRDACSETEAEAEAEGEGEAPAPSNSDCRDWRAVVEHLNQVAGAGYPTTDSVPYRELILGLFEKGYTQAQVVAVIDHKTEEWRGDTKMEKYLRPETLFGPKFPQYLGAIGTSSAGQERQKAELVVEAKAELARIYNDQGPDAARKYIVGRAGMELPLRSKLTELEACGVGANG